MDSDEDEIEFEVEEVTLCGHTLGITTVSHMPLSRLLKLGGNEVSGHKLWTGSTSLCTYLSIDNFSAVKGAQVIELGAGTGIAGMICALKGASKVWLTDHDVQCISHMMSDSERNSIDVEIYRLDWLRPSVDLFAQPGILNRDVPLVIIAGDVLYKSILIQPFFTTAKMLLSAHPNSQLILCHVPRAGVEHPIVVSGAEAQGLSVMACSDQFQELVDEVICPREDIINAHVYIIRLIEAST